MLEEKYKNLRAKFCAINGIDETLLIAAENIQPITSMDQLEHYTEFLITFVVRDTTPAENTLIAKIAARLDEFVAAEAPRTEDRDGKFYKIDFENQNYTEEGRALVNSLGWVS